MRFNESISKVLTNHDEWRGWLQTIIDTRHKWLTSQNYSGCYHKVSEEQYPERYPVLAMLDATTHGFSLSYIYQDQMMALLGLKDTFFAKHIAPANDMSGVYLLPVPTTQAVAKELESAPTELIEERTV